ncbi:hypothetical protein ACHHYP_00367 [Achlya hypogyna]|uniref:Transmembrane protein n=1 Tax=Achlya hypogyna TaxID=1202772 RepID=A0A1V9ZAX9_ACHHY|nr:hypothetical protein ACHHYP_00367 [Achlya hypogyna]
MSEADADAVAITLHAEAAVIMRSLELRRKGSVPEMSRQTPPSQYCACERCTFTWYQEPLARQVEPFGFDFKVFDYLQLLQNVVDPKAIAFCAECDASLTREQKLACVGYDGSWSVLGTSRSEKFEIYAEFVALSQSAGGWLLFVLLFYPFVALYFVLFPTAARPSGLVALWEHLPKFHCFLSCAYVWAVYGAIAVSTRFTAQAVFWGLLELYTVFLLLVGLAASTALRKKRAASTLFGAVYGWFLALQAVVFPSACLLVPLNLIGSIPSAHLVALAGAAALQLDVRSLALVDEHGAPLPKALLPGIFASTAVATRIRTRLLKYAVGLVAIVNGTMVLNLVLMLSWTTWVLPTGPILIPGVYSLVNSPWEVDYRISGARAAVCTSVNNSGVHTVWNLQLTPTPTAMNGLPLLKLRFHLAADAGTMRTLVPFHIDEPGIAHVLQQDGTQAVLAAQPGQGAFSVGATFDVPTCAVLDLYEPEVAVSYDDISVQAFPAVAESLGERAIAPIPAFLLTKFLFQLCFIAQCVGSCTVAIWTLWLKFNALLDTGVSRPLAPPGAPQVRIDLTKGTNLKTWYRLRCAVLAAVKLYAQFVQALVPLAMAQFAIAMGGLAVYCLTGVAPMPTYFLLLIALAGSLSILIYLFPLATVASLQAAHAERLRALLLELTEAKYDNRPVQDELLQYLRVLIDKLDHHDDRIRYWGMEISTAKLTGACVSLASAVSFLFTKSVQFNYSDKNPFYTLY